MIFLDTNAVIAVLNDPVSPVRARLDGAIGRGGGLAPIGPYDVLIAAQARRRNALLVTANGREFGRVPGLRFEDGGLAGFNED